MSNNKKAVRRRARATKSPAGPQRGGAGTKSRTRDVITPHDRLIPRGPELKHLDVNSGGYVAGVTSAGTLTSLTDIVQGVAGNQRTGDAVRIRGLDFRFAAYHQVGSLQGVLRFIVFSYNEDSAPTPALTLQSTGSASAVVSPYYLDHVENGSLNILFDSAYAGDSSPDAFFYHARRVVNLPVAFVTGTTNGSGKLHLLVISDAGLATNCANYQWWSRIFYDDV